MKYYIIDQQGTVIGETSDLDLAWSICETTARCGGALTIVSKREYDAKHK